MASANRRLAIPHHGLQRPGPDSPREPLAGRLVTRQDGHGQHAHHGVQVDLAEDAQGIGARLVPGGVGGVALLPEELTGTQEQPGPQFPADHVRPLVHQQRQVPVAVHPLGEEAVDDRLAGGADDDGLLEFPPPAMGDDRQLGAETLHVLGFALQVRLRDEEGEVGVGGPGGLDAAVDLGLHALPDGITPGADHHGAPDGAVVGQFGLGDDVLIPPGKVDRARGERRGHGPRRYGKKTARSEARPRQGSR
jgi:hypothetical protein